MREYFNYDFLRRTVLFQGKYWLDWNWIGSKHSTCTCSFKTLWHSMHKFEKLRLWITFWLTLHVKVYTSQWFIKRVHTCPYYLLLSSYSCSLFYFWRSSCSTTYTTCTCIFHWNIIQIINVWDYWDSDPSSYEVIGKLILYNDINDRNHIKVVLGIRKYSNKEATDINAILKHTTPTQIYFLFLYLQLK